MHISSSNDTPPFNTEGIDAALDEAQRHLDELTRAVDAKDHDTLDHSRRVAIIARALAVARGLSDAEADRVHTAGLLHDIGKIAIPDSILHKPDRLTEDEFAHMKSHPQIGAAILETIPELADLIPAILHHHERFDGQGYPRQLAGQSIPLTARILCLADSLDAMTSPRPYRNPLSLSNALNEIATCSGAQFDPDLSDHLLKIPQFHLQTLLAA